MAKVTVSDSNLENIGNAIREKNGNSTRYKPTEMPAAIRAIHTEPNLDQLSITQNGTYTPPSGTDGYDEVSVNVPNSYTASDEGKVVSSGALVSQTSTTITQNGTVDTTLNDEVVVNVSGGTPTLQDKTITQNGTYTADTGYDGLGEVTVNVSGGGGDIDFVGGVNGVYYPEDGEIGPVIGASIMYALGSNKAGLAPNWNNPFIIKVRFKMLSTKNVALFGSVGNYYRAPSVEARPGTNVIWFGISYNGSAWGTTGSITASDGITVPLNTWLTLEAEYDGTYYTITYNDGTNTVAKTITPTGTPYQNGTYFQFLNVSNDVNLIGTNTVIDAKSSYIKSNGVRIWGSAES